MKKNKFGSLIKELRENKKLTIEEFARLTDYTVVEVRNIENGKNLPRQYKLIVIAKALDCSFDCLLKECLSAEFDRKGE